ncbi:MAG: DUF4332 domain-containing protein [Planctomycetota bacterium]
MTHSVRRIEGIGSVYAHKLAAVGIQTTADLLVMCQTQAARTATSALTGVSAARLERWMRMADLMRLSEVGGRSARRLLAAGVNGLEELAKRSADELEGCLAKFAEPADVTLDRAFVARWIDRARAFHEKARIDGA